MSGATGGDRGFQPIRGAEDEDGLLEALAARKGIARLEAPARPGEGERAGQGGAAAPEAVPEAPAGRTPAPGPAPASPRSATTASTAAEPAAPAPTPRARMRAMNLELPDYVMRQLKERALREECSVRHLIMAALAASGVHVEPADLVPDGRRSRARRG